MLLRDKNIFVVEDNIHNRVVFQMTLTRHGANVFFERWGRGAIFRLQGAPNIQLIILDLMLADGCSGFDIFEQIRSLPDFASVPIVAVSAMEPSVAIPQARAKGFSAFISKPIDKYEFPQKIVSILDGEAVWDVGGNMELR